MRDVENYRFRVSDMLGMTSFKSKEKKEWG